MICRIAPLSLAIFALACTTSEPSTLRNDSNPTYRFVHWNIKELDSTKLSAAFERREQRAFQQVESSAAILRKLQPDFFSINEMHYDHRKSAPSHQDCDLSVIERFQTLAGDEEQNFDAYLRYTFGTEKTWYTTFCPANTGVRAQAARDGSFFSARPTIDRSRARDARDPNQPTLDTINFGWLPGQYSTGFASTYPIVDRKVEAAVTWHEWEPDFDFARFDIGFAPVTYTEQVVSRIEQRQSDGQLVLDAEGKPVLIEQTIERDLDPSVYQAQIRAINSQNDIYKTYELFDKNFNLSIVEIEGRRVAMITLHAVPAFGFDLERFGTSPNPERNRAQLEFMEWILFGSCEPQSRSKVRRCETKFKPLEGKMPFIATGDFNVSIDHPTNPGAQVMRRILSHPRTASAQLQDRRFGLALIPRDQLPEPVRVKIDAGTLTPDDFAQFNQETTFMPEGFDYRGRGRSRNQLLDYFVASHDIVIKRLEIYFPQPDFQDFGCLDPAAARELEAQERAKGRAVDVRSLAAQAGQAEQICVKSALADYGQLREASDHLPLILDFSLRPSASLKQ